MRIPNLLHSEVPQGDDEAEIHNILFTELNQNSHLNLELIMI